MLIAPELKETKAAMEDGHTVPSLTPPLEDGLLLLNTPMLQRTKLARRTEVASRSPVKRATEDALD